MMSMDAVTAEGFVPANYCDTSGNPSAAKVYRAARVILAQSGLAGYFGSGSGVASQEQFHSAYGLAKAFLEVGLSIPAVVRLGGNSEDRAVEILQDACRGLPGNVEGYKKDDTPAACARRFRQLVEQSPYPPKPMKRRVPLFVGTAEAYSMVEYGYVIPGSMVVGSDSHSNLYGGVSAPGTPVVRTDAASLWATGETWWQVPPVARVHLKGRLRPGVVGKDVIIALCGLFNHDEGPEHGRRVHLR
jgi:hypothetical protein